MSNEQAQLHRDILAFGKSGAAGSALSAVQKLMQLYQHSSLITDNEVMHSPEHYLNQSPKLQSVIGIIEQIARKREKVLIFTRSLLMQQILKSVLQELFGLVPSIINGSKGSGRQADGYRQKLINDFEAKDGFNYIILSPEVAGVGLTIIGANHVIHYGRWWNPAIESQATDRCYRLGQTKTVNVYYPLSLSREFKSFDERLQKMLWQKRDLASDFLVPTEKLVVDQADLFAELSNDEANNQNATLVEPSFAATCTLLELESLYSAVLLKQGFETFLSSRSGDQRPLFIARQKKLIKLIICRTNDSRAISDDIANAKSVITALSRRVDIGNKYEWRTCIVTNHSIATKITKELKGDCELIDLSAIQKLIKTTKVTIPELLKEDCDRILSPAEIISKLV